MPWHIGKSSSCPASKPYAVIQNDNSRVMGCHKTEASAKKQLAALYANEGKSIQQMKRLTLTEALRAMAEGEDYNDVDIMFLNDMVSHHAAAIAMAQGVIARGKNPDVKKLAQGIITAQQAEIDQMNNWLDDMSEGDAND